MDRRLFLTAALALAGCATMPAPRPAASPPYAELEPVYGASAGRDGLTLRVASNGCTSRPDFTFYVETRGQAVQIAFARRRIDACKSFARGKTELTFTWAELGLDPRAPVFLLNPLLAWTGP
jgi:hypothetical protein